MFCRYCGNEISETDIYCSKCGVRLKETIQQDFASKTKNEILDENPKVLEDKTKLENKIFVFGILSVAFAQLSLFIGFAILTLVFANVANKAYEELQNICGEDIDAKARVGKGLAKGGKIAGRIMIPVSIAYWLQIIFVVFLTLIPIL